MQINRQNNASTSTPASTPTSKPSTEAGVTQAASQPKLQSAQDAVKMAGSDFKKSVDQMQKALQNAASDAELGHMADKLNDAMAMNKLKQMTPDQLKQHIDDNIKKRDEAQSKIAALESQAMIGGPNKAEMEKAQKDLADANKELERCKQVAPELVKGEEAAAHPISTALGGIAHALGLDKPVEILPFDPKHPERM